MLYAIQVPKNGGETLVADMVAAYEALDPNLKSNLEKLTAKHYYGRAQFDPDEHRPVPIRTKNKLPLMQFAKNPLS